MRARDRGIEASVGTADHVSDADIVCTCTTADAPLFDGRLLGAGAHVNAVGTHLATARELDTATIRRAKVVVETREAALAEAGELVLAIEEGAIEPTTCARIFMSWCRGDRSHSRTTM